jgi:hypothetical protein
MVSEYEFRFVREGGRLALVCVTHCQNDLDARVAAQMMMQPEFETAEIWRGLERITTLSRRDTLN